jgi:predicted enzyme related to lactoylglutathione lyase
MSGRVVHFEIPFDDGDRARSFYKEVFGWSIQEIPEMQYTMVGTGPADEQGMPSEPGFIGGGMMGRDGPASTPVITIEVDDIDAALGTIAGKGGRTVAEKMQVGEMGWAAYFADSEGNVMGLWQSATPS